MSKDSKTKEKSMKNTRDKHTEDNFKQLIEDMSDGYTIIQGGKVVFANERFCDIYGYKSKEILKKSLADFSPPENRQAVIPMYESIMRGEMPPPGRRESQGVRADGTVIIAETTSKIIEYDGKPALSLITRDITERKRIEEELREHKEKLEEMVKERTSQLERQLEITQRQSEEILEISTPVMQIWEGVLVAPLIGTLDSQRTQQFMERLLERIVETNSPLTLVDITGVPTIDTQTAQHLIDTISAVRMLGAEVIMTGVRPPIAQTLVHLGIDLSGITTRPSLSAGLKVALGKIREQS